MQDPTSLFALAGFCAAGLALTSAAALRAWTEWLELKRLEYKDRANGPSPAGRGELARLRERVRRLEAIASGVDL